MTKENTVFWNFTKGEPQTHTMEQIQERVELQYVTPQVRFLWKRATWVPAEANLWDYFDDGANMRVFTVNGRRTF